MPDNEIRDISRKLGLGMFMIGVMLRFVMFSVVLLTWQLGDTHRQMIVGAIRGMP